MKAKIDGKEYVVYDFVKDIKDGIFESVCDKIISFIEKKYSNIFRKTANEVKKNPKININDFYEKFSSIICGNTELMKQIKKAVELILENEAKEKSKDLMEGGGYLILELFRKMTQNNIVVDTMIEKKIFKKPDFLDNDNDNEEDNKDNNKIPSLMKNVADDFFLIY